MLIKKYVGYQKRLRHDHRSVLVAFCAMLGVISSIVPTRSSD
ncbi:hypothetical protein SKA34_20762 [Photobacterium sp. SKA34]|nr:hypothetical protein SKA34_20762 [Photobacterium sp. SKA34]